MRSSPSARAFTIVELLVVVSIIALLVGILLPAIGKARDSALVTQSTANVRNLSVAHGTYSADWSDRQWTAIPDDAGLVGGSCANYLQLSCPPQMLLGWDAATVPTLWGYYLGSTGQCSSFGWEGSCGNWAPYTPNTFSPNTVIGSFRLSNCKSFNTYLNGRFYDPVFYAPKDTLALEAADKFFGLPDEFTSETNTDLVFTTYCLSPAAMWAPDVLSLNTTTMKYFTPPGALPGGYRAPSAGLARYPDLKTRVLEHNWLQNNPSDVNYNFAGGATPWYFNHGINSAPVTLFFDGHISLISASEAMDSDKRSEAQGGEPLWSRQTTLGANGYYGNESYDFYVDTSYHILTTFGILGRDTMGAKG